MQQQLDIHHMKKNYFGVPSADQEVKRKILLPGDATNYPINGDTCLVHYEGWLEDGTKFDSSRGRDVPFVFRLGAGQVVPGWDRSIGHMSLGEVCEIVVPPDLAYGKDGYDPVVPRDATLRFEIELLSFTD